MFPYFRITNVILKSNYSKLYNFDDEVLDVHCRFPKVVFAIFETKLQLMAQMILLLLIIV